MVALGLCIGRLLLMMERCLVIVGRGTYVVFLQAGLREAALIQMLQRLLLVLLQLLLRGWQLHVILQQEIEREEESKFS